MELLRRPPAGMSVPAERTIDRILIRQGLHRPHPDLGRRCWRLGHENGSRLLCSGAAVAEYCQSGEEQPDRAQSQVGALG